MQNVGSHDAPNRSRCGARYLRVIEVEILSSLRFNSLSTSISGAIVSNIL